MARITGSLASVNSVPTEGTVLVRALTLRPGSTFAVTGEPKVAVIKAGAFTIEDVEPGPVQLTIQGNGVTHDIRVDVPERDEVDFLDLLEDVYEWEPAQISAVKLAAREARRSADEAGRIASAFRGAEQLEGWADSASESAASAVRSAGEAASSAEAAEGSASEAAVSAAAAASSAATAGEHEGRAGAHADSAGSHASAAAGSAEASGASAAGAAGSADRAKAEADRATGQAEAAEVSAGEAKANADRAEGVVDSVSWDDDKLTVAGKTSPSLRGPKGEPGEPGGIRGIAVEGDGNDPQATGTQALALGWGAKVEGSYSAAVGASASSPGNSSAAVGASASSPGNSSAAVGYRAQSAGSYSVAVGGEAKATKDFSTAVGYRAETTDARQVRIGRDNSAGYHVSLAGDVRLTDEPGRPDNATTKAYVDGQVAEAKALIETRAVVRQVTDPPSDYEPGVLYVIPE